jgi:hypothetical protein
MKRIMFRRMTFGMNALAQQVGGRRLGGPSARTFALAQDDIRFSIKRKVLRLRTG